MSKLPEKVSPLLLTFNCKFLVKLMNFESKSFLVTANFDLFPDDPNILTLIINMKLIFMIFLHTIHLEYHKNSTSYIHYLIDIAYKCINDHKLLGPIFELGYCLSF